MILFRNNKVTLSENELNASWTNDLNGHERFTPRNSRYCDDKVKDYVIAVRRIVATVYEYKIIEHWTYKGVANQGRLEPSLAFSNKNKFILILYLFIILH